ncbi:MAG: nuclear transport factor 2 family protein [Nitrospinota bacterium]|nr:nuclear transport factor 2 family protein [Nitrospinota bacterium]
MPDQDSAITANEKFYKAFNARDLSAMKEIWSSHQNVTCVHPGWSPLNGFEPIIDSWQGIFKNSGNMDIQISDINMLTSNDLAWVSCVEKLYTIASHGVLASKVFSTNLFKLNKDGWKMIMHHASPMPSMPESEEV